MPAPQAANIESHAPKSDMRYLNALRKFKEILQEFNLNEKDFFRLKEGYDELQVSAALAGVKAGASSSCYRRTALISDIHGNYQGLLAVLKDIRVRNCDRTPSAWETSLTEERKTTR